MPNHLSPQSFFDQTSAASLPGIPGFGTDFSTIGQFGQPDGIGGIQPAQDLATTPWKQLGAYEKLGVITQGLGAFTSLANLYGMFKNQKLQKKAFAFSQEGTKRNFNASATGFNNQVDQYQGARQASALANNRSLDTLGQYAPQKVSLWT